MNYIRKISQIFIDDLNTGKLKTLLEVVKSAKDLQLEIRKNYVQIYFLGGQLLKIEQKRAGYKFDFDVKYCLIEQNKNYVNDLKTKCYTIAVWLIAIPTLKTIMQEWFNENKNKKMERQIQQAFCRENASSGSHYFIVDMEYQTGKLSRVDMLGLTKRGDELKIVLIELKQGYKSVSGKSGLIKHYRDFVSLIKNNSSDLIETVKNIYSNKVALGLIPDCFDITKISGFEILFLLYDYSDNGILLGRALHKIAELNEDIPFDCKRISKGIYTV